MAVSVVQYRRARRITWFAALCGLVLATWALTVQRGDAQTPLDDPTAAFIAARAHLAIEIGAPIDAITLARAEPVTWNDGCLGLAGADEFCTQALVDGWALWLRGANQLYRVHTNADGSVIRSAGAVDVAPSIPELPLPEAAALRVQAPSPAPAGGAGTVPSRAASAPVVGLLLAVAGVALIAGRWLSGRAERRPGRRRGA